MKGKVNKMKKLYHLVLAESEKKPGGPIQNMKVLSDTLWVDMDKCAERGRSLIHNEYLNDSYRNSIHKYDPAELTKEQILEGLIFVVGYYDVPDDLKDLLIYDKSIFIVEEKSLLLRILANLCNKTNPNFINGYNYRRD